MEKNTSIESQVDYYNHYWTDRVSRLNKEEIWRLSEIIKALSMIEDINKKNDFQICDLGCGTGWLSNELVKFGDVFGVDLSPEGVDLASQRWPAVKKFEAHNILDWRPENKFDIVVSSEVIEHITDKNKFMDTVNSILSPGGYIILTTPNGKVKKAWESEGRVKQMIEAWVTPKQLKNLMSDDFEVIYLRTFYNNFSYTRIHRVMSAPKILKIIKAIGLSEIYDSFQNVLRFGLYQVVVARKKTV